MRFRRNLLELLHLKSCQRKHGEREAGQGLRANISCPGAQPWCQLRPESLVTALPFNLQLLGVLPVKAEGGAKRRGKANVNGVTKLEQLAFCLECEDSGPWQMTAAVPANVLSLDNTCDTFCFSRAYFKGNGKHVSCRKFTAVLGKCFLSSFRKCCSPDTSKTGFYLNW